MNSTLELPIIEWSDKDEGRKYKHEVPMAWVHHVDLDTLHFPSGEFARPFKSFVVELLASIRDVDQSKWVVRGEPLAREYCEFHHLIEPTFFQKISPYAGEVVYRITEEGLAFLKIHEAPATW